MHCLQLASCFRCLLSKHHRDRQTYSQQHAVTWCSEDLQLMCNFAQHHGFRRVDSDPKGSAKPSSSDVIMVSCGSIRWHTAIASLRATHYRTETFIVDRYPLAIYCHGKVPYHFPFKTFIHKGFSMAMNSQMVKTSQRRTIDGGTLCGVQNQYNIGDPHQDPRK